MYPRNGLPLKEMTAPQRKLAHDLMKAGLSQSGYLTTTAIMAMTMQRRATDLMWCTDRR